MARPKIVVGKSDHVRLTPLANGLLERRPELVEGLLAELERAKVARDEATKGAVQMGSTVEYTTESGHGRRVTLVYPIEADIERNKISILTPIGTALLGLSAGQSINFVGNDGREHTLTVVFVK